MADKKPFTLFRQKNLDKLETPEALDQYLRVTSPGVWGVLAAVILFLIGAIVWGSMAQIDSTVTVAVVSEASGTYALVPEEALNAVIENHTVLVKGESLDLSPKSIDPMAVPTDADVYILKAGGLQYGQIVYPIPLTNSLDEGVYSGTIVTETISPLSLLLR